MTTAATTVDADGLASDTDDRDAETVDPVDGGGDGRPDPHSERGLLGLSVLVAWIPTAYSVAWACFNGEWQAGDRAIMGIFTHDVFSRNTPLVATVSTMGNYAESEGAASVHHLGPAQFWALAIPDWITGGRPIGLLIGALWINLACIALVVIFTKRRLGIHAAAGMTLVCTLLSYGLGASLLRDIWTPFLGLWPLFALMVLTWSLLDGDTRALPYAVVVATFLAQIELLFVAPAMVLSVVGGGGLLLRRAMVHRRRNAVGHPAELGDPPLGFDDDELFTTPVEERLALDDLEPEPVPGSEPEFDVPPQDLVPLKRPLLISLALAVWLWLPVAWDELHGKPGNITLLWRALHEQADRAGGEFVFNNLIAQVKFPPMWVIRAESTFDVGQVPTTFEKVTALLFVVVFIAATVVAWLGRRAHPARFTLMVTCYAVLAAGFANLSITPEDGTIGLQYRRWMWPSGAFLWFALGVVVVTELLDRTPVRRLRTVPARVIVLPLLALSLLVCIPAGTDQLSPPSADVADNKVIESMWGPLLDRLPPQPTYVSPDGVVSAFGIGPEIVRRMLAAGFEVRVPSYAVDSYGKHRAYTTENGKVAQKLSIVSAETSLAPPGQPLELLAAGRTDGASGESFVKLARPVLAQAQGAPPIVLTPAGRLEVIEARFAGEENPNGSLDDLLNHPTRAIFDADVLKVIAAGGAIDAPLTPQQASAMYAEIGDLGALAFLEEAPPPEKPSN